MTDEELLQWYKNNNTSKPTDMSEKDYELNMNKAIKLQQDKLLQDNLNSQQSALAQQQKNAEQSASISNEKLLKYLGQKQQASGLASGQTSSDFINANNNYIANRANIANNAMQQQTDLLNSYNANKMQNESDAYNNEISILDKYRQRENEDKQLEQVRQDKAFDEFMTIINSQSFNSTSELDNLYAANKDYFSDNQKNFAEHMIDYYKNNPQQQEIEKQADFDSSAILSGKEYLNYNGQDYQISENNKIDLSESNNSEILYTAVKELLGKNNPYDTSIQNGMSMDYKDAYISWLTSSGHSKEQSEKMANYMGEGFNNLALTFFDGEWYISQKR